MEVVGFSDHALASAHILTNVATTRSCFLGASMLSPWLSTKHLRPTHLSDPGFDFKPPDLVELLSISDDRMTWRDYACMLGPLLPAAR